ncbi:hypothetical protein P4S72_23415 [Vibrio sp. PP-XX7]
MAQYKTPNVYVKEQSTLPPSVAEVATAIPAFIGYTEITTDKIDDSISIVNKPNRITNMSEYEAIYGGAYSEDILVDFNEGAGEFFIPQTEATAMAKFFSINLCSSSSPMVAVRVMSSVLAAMTRRREKTRLSRH